MTEQIQEPMQNCKAPADHLLKVVDLAPPQQPQKKTDGNTAFLRAARSGNLEKVLEFINANVDINTSNSNGLNALHLASKDGHVEVAAELLKRGANVDAATKKGNTALHIASLAGQEEVVKLLIEHGASVNLQSQSGFTPLYMAAQENHERVVRYLLNNGANQSLATEDGFTPLAVAMQQGHDKVVTELLENDTRGKIKLPALHIAAKKDDCKAAALLLQSEHNPDITSKSGFTPLHIASHYGNDAIASLLLAKGADVNYAAKHNITPLHVAAKWGRNNMVILLLDKGASIIAKTRDGLTPLHCAARSGHEQVVDTLLQRHAPITAKTKNGLAPLHMASQGDHVEAARVLLTHRAPVDDVTVDYLTALHVASHCGHVSVAKLLLDRKADPNARALNGFTPLHIACKKNRVKIVELLLKHGGSIEATTESGLSPLHVASFMGCMNIVIYLLQCGANPDVSTIRGETPLHLASRANQTDIIRILLRNGAQVDAKAREQQTPLHIAARLGNTDIVMLLLQHGANVDSVTKDLYTSLHIAAKEDQEEVAQTLLENGASMTAATKKGFTPLHLAAKYGRTNIATLLLQRGAPVDAQGKNGVTPLHVASHYDHQGIALLLLDKGASPHATAKNGHTPLHIAAKKNQMDIAAMLLEYGANAGAESKAGFTPLHLSAQEGHVDMTNLLLEHKADVNHSSKNGLTPLHLCAQEDCVDVAAILTKNGADADAITKAGYTPLHIASHFGQLNMVRFLLTNKAKVDTATSTGYTPLHQAAQQGNSAIVAVLLDSGASPDTKNNQGQTALCIAQKLGYISVVEVLKNVTDNTKAAPTAPAAGEEKYKVVAPETMQENFMSDSEDEGGEDATNEQSYRYLTIDEMKSLGDDSLPIDTTREDRYDTTAGVDESISPQHTFNQMNAAPVIDNVDVTRAPVVQTGFLVSFLVDAKGGAMRGCRHSGVRVIVPPQCVTMPTRVTCRYVRRDKPNHPPPPPLMESEALASRILELGPVGVKFLGPVVIEVPNFAALRANEREIVILRSDNGETWREHTVDSSNEAVHDILSRSFDKDGNQIQLDEPNRITSIVTHDFPHYFAIVSRIRQEVHAIGPEGGMVSSSVVPQVQAVFPQGALTKKIKVGLQAQPIPSELTATVLGNCVAVSPIVTIEPRRRKFHKPITLTLPVPQAANKGMINQYSGDAPTLRLLCSITGGTSRAQWEDVTGSTPLTFVKECVSFTTTVSARFWLMDIRDIAVATKKATELYREAIHIPFMAKFVVFAKRIDNNEARLRVFCMTDDKEDKTLESQEHFTEVAKSRDVEVLEGKKQLIELSGNLISVTKSGDQLKLGFNAFQENRLPFTVRIKDSLADPIGRMLFFKEQKPVKTSTPHPPICVLNIVLPDTIIPESDFADSPIRKYYSLNDSQGYHRSELKFSDISNLIGDDWEALADKLGVRSSECKVIKIENPESTARQSSVMLKQWHQRAGNKASANILESALLNIGREDIVRECFLNTSISKNKIPNGNGLISYKIEDIHGGGKNEHYTADDDDERKYTAEEKIIDDSELKSVSERKMEIERRLLDEQNNKKDAPKERGDSVEEKRPPSKQQSEEREVVKTVVRDDDVETFEPTKLTFQQKRLSFEKGYSVDKILSEGIAGDDAPVVLEEPERSGKKEKSVEKEKPPRKEKSAEKVVQKESSVERTETQKEVKSAKEGSAEKDPKSGPVTQKSIEKPARKETSVEKSDSKIPIKQKTVEKPARKESSVEKTPQKEISPAKADHKTTAQSQTKEKSVTKGTSVEKTDQKVSPVPAPKEKLDGKSVDEKVAEKIPQTGTPDKSTPKETKIDQKEKSEDKVTIKTAQIETPIKQKVAEKPKPVEEKVSEKLTPKETPTADKSTDKVVSKEKSVEKINEKTVTKIEEKICEKSAPKIEEKIVEKSASKADEKIAAKEKSPQLQISLDKPKLDSVDKDEKTLSFQEKRLSFEHPIAPSQTTEAVKLQNEVKIENSTTHKDTRDKETRDNDTRRDSELFEGVTLGLGKLDAKPIPPEQNFLSPIPLKTPPPSPAEFKDTGEEWHKTDSLDSNKSNKSATDLETPSSDVQPSPTDSSSEPLSSATTAAHEVNNNSRAKLPVPEHSFENIVTESVSEIEPPTALSISEQASESRAHSERDKYTDDLIDRLIEQETAQLLASGRISYDSDSDDETRRAYQSLTKSNGRAVRPSESSESSDENVVCDAEAELLKYLSTAEFKDEQVASDHSERSPQRKVAFRLHSDENELVYPGQTDSEESTSSSDNSEGSPEPASPSRNHVDTAVAPDHAKIPDTQPATEVERKFERMASETSDDVVKVEGEFHRIVSQLSFEEVTDCLNAWDETESATRREIADKAGSPQGDKRAGSMDDTGLLSRVLENDTDVENADYFSKKKFWQSFESAGSERSAPVPRPRASISEDAAPAVAKRSSENIRCGFIASKSESLQERCVSDTERFKPSMKKVHSLTAYSTDSEAEYIASCGIEKLAYENVAFSEEEESASEATTPRVGGVRAKKMMFEQMQRESSSQESVTSPPSSRVDEIGVLKMAGVEGRSSSKVAEVTTVVTSSSSTKSSSHENVEIGYADKTTVSSSQPSSKVDEISGVVKTSVTTSSPCKTTELTSAGKTTVVSSQPLTKVDEVTGVKITTHTSSSSSKPDEIASAGKTVVTSSQPSSEVDKVTGVVKTTITTSSLSSKQGEPISAGKTTVGSSQPLTKVDEVTGVKITTHTSSSSSKPDEIASAGKTVVTSSQPSSILEKGTDVKTPVTGISPSSKIDEVSFVEKTTIVSSQQSSKVEQVSGVNTTETSVVSSQKSSEIEGVTSVIKTTIVTSSSSPKNGEVGSGKVTTVVTSQPSPKLDEQTSAVTITSSSSPKNDEVASTKVTTVVTSQPSSKLDDQTSAMKTTVTSTSSSSPKNDEVASTKVTTVVTSQPSSKLDEQTSAMKTIVTSTSSSSPKNDEVASTKVTTVVTSQPSPKLDEQTSAVTITSSSSPKNDEVGSTKVTTVVTSQPSSKLDEETSAMKTTVTSISSSSPKNDEVASTKVTTVVPSQPSPKLDEQTSAVTITSSSSPKNDEVGSTKVTTVVTSQPSSKPDEQTSAMKTTVNSTSSSSPKNDEVASTKVTTIVTSQPSSKPDEQTSAMKTTVTSTSSSSPKNDEVASTKLTTVLTSQPSPKLDEQTSAVTITSSSSSKNDEVASVKKTTLVTSQPSSKVEVVEDVKSTVITSPPSSKHDEVLSAGKTAIVPSPRSSKLDEVTSEVKTTTTSSSSAKVEEVVDVKTTVTSSQSSSDVVDSKKPTITSTLPSSKTEEVKDVKTAVVTSPPSSKNDTIVSAGKSADVAASQSSSVDEVVGVVKSIVTTTTSSSSKNDIACMGTTIIDTNQPLSVKGVGDFESKVVTSSSSSKNDDLGTAGTTIVVTVPQSSTVDGVTMKDTIASSSASYKGEVGTKVDAEVGKEVLLDKGTVKESTLSSQTTSTIVIDDKECTIDDIQTNGTLDESVDNTQSESDITPEDLGDKQFLMQDWESTNEMLENIAHEKDVGYSIKTVTQGVSLDSRGYSEDDSEALKEEAHIAAEILINEIEEELGRRPDIVECLLKSKLDEMVDEIAATSSNDITDEDLKSTGTDADVPTYGHDDTTLSSMEVESKVMMKISEASPTEYEIKYEQVEEFNMLESVDYEEPVLPEETDGGVKNVNESFTTVCKEVTKPSKIPIRNGKPTIETIPRRGTDLHRKSSEEDKSRTSTSPEYVQDFMEVRQTKCRKSGTDFEPCSSSSESHYQSFEHSGTASRPLSSDVEGLLSCGIAGTTGSSEYETAASHDTSHDFHTAMSSASIHESIKSIDSESSGNLGSAEVSSEVSETLVASTAELEHDVDMPTSHYYDETKKSVFRRSPVEPYDNEIPMDVIKGASRSLDASNLQSFATEQRKSVESKMTGQSRGVEETHDTEDRLLSSTEDVSSFSITDGGSNLQTVVEPNSAESDRMDNSLISERSLTMSATSMQFSTSSCELKDEIDTDKRTAEVATSVTKPVVPTMAPKIDKSDSKDTISRDLSMDDIPNITISHHSTPPPKQSPIRDAPVSPDSESFEMIEQPDEMDDFVIVEEVAKEACEQDREGKGIRITEKRVRKNFDDEVHNLPPKTTSTLTKVEYYGGVDGCGFPIEGVNEEKPGTDEEYESSPPNDNEIYDQEVEEGKKWIEMQFQADSEDASSYEYSYERVPLEDIKEEDTDDMHSSKMGSVSSQISQSIGSLGSMKQSLSSTPDYDILAGKRYFTKSSDRDDVSQGSLQEFERLEQMMALESMKSKLSGSQDSLGSSVSGKKRNGDDASISSLKEFEGLEDVCAEAEKIEERALAEERLLSQIEEGHESQASESESCETLEKSCYAESDDDDDYDQKMFEIDEIIRQAQSNVEKFIDVDRLEKTESLGRGDSLEETARIPDFELDQPLTENTHSSSDVYSGKKYIEHFDIEHSLTTSTDSLEVKSKPESVMVTSTDSLEVTTKSKRDLISDSLDCADRAESPRSAYDTEEELRNVGSDREAVSPPHLTLSSPDSLEATSSAATHATYHNETDSAMSSSFTSAGSNTMVSSTENLENIVTNYSNWLDGHPYMTEVAYNVSEKSYVTTERVAETPTDVKIASHGQDARKLYEKDMAAFKPGEYYTETEEIDSDGNLHVKKVIESRAVVTSEKIQNTEKIILDPEQYRSDVTVTHFATRSNHTRIESAVTTETSVRHEQKEVSGDASTELSVKLIILDKLPEYLRDTVDWFIGKARRRDKELCADEPKLYLEESVLENKLPDITFRTLIELPSGLDYNEWLASHTIAIFDNVNLMYGTISEFCTATGCPDMVGPGFRTYLWFDDKGKKTRVSAPQYVDYVMTFTQKTINDEAVFPTKYPHEFPSSFETIVRKILRLLFHVLAHLYHSHFREMVMLNLHSHLNSVFTHLIILNDCNHLIDDRELEILFDLVHALKILENEGSAVKSSENRNSINGCLSTDGSADKQVETSPAETSKSSEPLASYSDPNLMLPANVAKDNATSGTTEVLTSINL